MAANFFVFHRALDVVGAHLMVNKEISRGQRNHDQNNVMTDEDQRPVCMEYERLYMTDGVFQTVS